MAIATSPSRPRFRNDLVAEPIDEDGQRFIDVIDPDTGSAFRFYEVEYSLACAMDGERDVAGLVSWAQEELGITPTSNELASVIATLGDLGYLDDGTRAPADVAVSPGVVAPPPMRPEPSMDDFELGPPGPAPELPPAKQPPATIPSRRTPPPMPAVQPPSDLGRDLTPPGGLDVDLSADMGIGIGDVKEAVRQSKVMKAQEMPPDVQSAFESAQQSGRMPAAPPERVASSAPVQALSVDLPPPVTPREAPAEGKKKVKQARETQRVRAQADPAARPVSPVLIALLVLVLLGAGGFMFWKFYWTKRPTSGGTAGTTTKPVVAPGSGSALVGSAGTGPVEPPPPPRPIEAALALVNPSGVDVIAPIEGEIETTADDGALVNKGDLIATFGGTKKILGNLRKLNTAIARTTADLEEAKTDFADAQARGSESGQRRASAKVKEGEDDLAEQQEDKTGLEAQLEKLVVRAPETGMIKVVVGAGKKAAANAVIATIQPSTLVTATFELTPGKTYEVGAPVELTIKTPAEGGPATLTCTAFEVSGTKLVAHCPNEGSAEGTLVVLP